MKTHPFRLFSVCVVSLGLFGSFLTVWLAPRFIAWWIQPPVRTAFDCKPQVDYALQHFQYAQLFGLLGGAVAGFVLFLFLLFRAKRSANHAPAPITRRPL